MTLEILTAGGRIVWGHPTRSQIQKDQRTKQPKLNKEGKPTEQWAFGLAIPKAEFGPLWAAMQQEAATAYPNGVPNGFSWKIKDGDGVDRQGKPYASREGYAGCWIVTISTTSFAPGLYKFENGAYRQLTVDEIKTGDYARASLILKVNVPTDTSHTPGLYVNPKGVEFLGYGQEIQNGGGDPDEMFGGAPVAVLPAGASAMPISSAPVSVAMPGQQPMANQPQYGPAPAAQPQYGPAPAAQPQYGPAPAQHMPAPAHDFVANAGQPQYGPQPQAAPQPYAVNAAPGPQYGPAPAVNHTAAPVTSYPSNQPQYGPAPAAQPQYGPAPAAQPMYPQR